MVKKSGGREGEYLFMTYVPIGYGETENSMEVKGEIIFLRGSGGRGVNLMRGEIYRSAMGGGN